MESRSPSGCTWALTRAFEVDENVSKLTKLILLVFLPPRAALETMGGSTELQSVHRRLCKGLDKLCMTDKVYEVVAWALSR